MYHTALSVDASYFNPNDFNPKDPNVKLKSSNPELLIKVGYVVFLWSIFPIQFQISTTKMTQFNANVASCILAAEKQLTLCLLKRQAVNLSLRVFFFFFSDL